MPRRSTKGISRPHVWKSGPDPVEHYKYKVWLQQKAQASFRLEKWELSFEKWKEIWSDYWDQRGRDADEYCMTRRDWEDGWYDGNVHIVTRREHGKALRLNRSGRQSVK